MSASKSLRILDQKAHPAASLEHGRLAIERWEAWVRKPHVSCSVVLLLFLVGCGGATRSLRPGISQGIFRYSEQYGSAPTQGFSGGHMGEEELPRAVPWSVPRSATTAAEAGTATGEALVAGGTVVAVGGSVVLVCLTAKAVANGMPTPIDIADTFYGTHFGDLQGWVQGCYAPKATVDPEAPKPTLEVKSESEPHAPSEPRRSPEADEDRDKKDGAESMQPTRNSILEPVGTTRAARVW